ncbi:hypothetical protein WT75_19565 [Burkholderia stagnalis]|nr:hypothetical protein WT75_19565 [Burkholderia stagnalis]KWN15269.1 hypothetical protein WT84_20360 [Burkholderia stagnalis]KWN27661.1 hypothetical protein WT85_21725 [Burkholderia stagnalis]
MLRELIQLCLQSVDPELESADRVAGTKILQIETDASLDLGSLGVSVLLGSGLFFGEHSSVEFGFDRKNLFSETTSLASEFCQMLIKPRTRATDVL